MKFRRTMLEETVKDYAAYLKLDASSGFQTVQDVIDNMLTRLEELVSVLQMIKAKNNDCNISITEDISKYRSEISTLSKKIMTIEEVIIKLERNIDTLEKNVEKAEADFGLHSENKLKSFLKPFLKSSKDTAHFVNVRITVPETMQFSSIMDNFTEP